MKCSNCKKECFGVKHVNTDSMIEMTVSNCCKAITFEGKIEDSGCNHEVLKPVGGSEKYFKCCECDKLINSEDEIKKTPSFIENMQSLNPGWDFSQFPLVFPKDEELKDCPFCGGPASYGSSKDGVFVSCSDCQSSSDHLLDNNKTEEEAREAWNNRIPKQPPIKVLRDIICFKEQKDKTYDVILVLQGYQLGHNNKTQCISNQKLLCNILPSSLDLMVELYRKCNDNVNIEFLEKAGNCDYGVNNPTSFQSEDSSKRFFKPK